MHLQSVMRCSTTDVSSSIMLEHQYISIALLITCTSSNKLVGAFPVIGCFGRFIEIFDPWWNDFPMRASIIIVVAFTSVDCSTQLTLIFISICTCQLCLIWWQICKTCMKFDDSLECLNCGRITPSMRASIYWLTASRWNMDFHRKIPVKLHRILEIKKNNQYIPKEVCSNKILIFVSLALIRFS